MRTLANQANSALSSGTVIRGAAYIAERIRQCFEDKEWSTLSSLYHEDAVQEWPQSGERFVGRDNIVAVGQNYPDLPEMKGFRVVAEVDSLAVSKLLLDYGGRRYHAVAITEVEEGLVRKRTECYNETFEPAEWRSKMVREDAERYGQVIHLESSS